MKIIKKLLPVLLISFTALPPLAESSASEAANLPYAVPYELGDSEFAAGDSVTIGGLRGTSKAIQQGETYCVTGTYTLNSQAGADLSFFATTTNRAASPIAAEQTMHVTKGTGSFRLVKKMTEQGYLHVTFYSKVTGQGFGGVYFGQGDWVLRDKHFHYGSATPRPEGAPPQEGLSLAGPNQALFDYLGNPVAAPSDMNTAYSKEGLIQAMQAAAQSAGISLVKLEIDDSEFPFLVGVVFAKPVDKEKLKEQLGKVPAYALSGGVGGDTSYAMNIVPHPAFPSESSQRIYRRMILREAVLHEKISSAH